MNRQYVSGCQAVAMAVSLSEADVVAAYPITPQTSIVESLATKIAAGELRAQMVHVESEHSAMSVCVGAACVRSGPFTASCGQGLAYMKEPVFWAAGLRLPIVMAVTNRSLLGPNTIFCDHQDAISTRDSGWLQLYAETCQEVLDSVILAYRVAEDTRPAAGHGLSRRLLPVPPERGRGCAGPGSGARLPPQADGTATGNSIRPSRSC